VEKDRKNKRWQLHSQMPEKPVEKAGSRSVNVALDSPLALVSPTAPPPSPTGQEVT